MITLSKTLIVMQVIVLVLEGMHILNLSLSMLLTPLWALLLIWVVAIILLFTLVGSVGLYEKYKAEKEDK